MKINFDVERLREDYLRTVKIKFGEDSAEGKLADNLEDIDLIKKAKSEGFELLAYIDGVTYDSDEKMSAYEAKCAAELYFDAL